MNSRQRDILKTIIERYISSAEPVGSKAVSEKLRLSSATIRNEMAELSEHGMLTSPHTSSGRVPTAAAYRLYVDELMNRHRLSIEETEELNSALRTKVAELENLLNFTVRIISQMINLPAYAASGGVRRTVITRYDIIEVDNSSYIIVLTTSVGKAESRLVKTTFTIPEGLLIKCAAVFNASFTGITEDKITSEKISAAARAADDSIGITSSIASFVIETLTSAEESGAVIAGQAKILNYPEFQDADKARAIIEYLSREDKLPALPLPLEGENVRIAIGPENEAEPLHESGVVVARRPIGDGRDLVVGVVGPARMDYSKISSRLDFLASRIAQDTG